MKNNKPNIIFVSLDGVRADVAYSGKFNAINELMKDSVVFKKAISSAPLTPISHASVFTGKYPFNHGIRHLFVEKILEDVPLLSEILKEESYKTYAVVSCPGLNGWYGFSRGYDSYDDEVPLARNGSTGLNTVDVKERGFCAKKASEVVDKAIKVLEAHDNQFPLFLFMHFFDAHWPYTPPMPYDERFKDNLYEGEVAYIDSVFGGFIKSLKAKGLYEDSILVVFSDHGEDLNGLYKNDHGGAELGHPEEEGHGCLLYDATQHVTLFIKLPEDHKCVKAISEQVRLVDIVPTMLDYLGAGAEGLQFDGTSLRQHIEGKGKDLIAYSETHYPTETSQLLNKYPDIKNTKSIRIKNNNLEYKVIWHIDSDKVEIYNLSTDPEEKKNLINNT